MPNLARCIALAAALAQESCSEECAVEACEDIERAQPKGSIETGIVGVVAYKTDVCENECCECTYGATMLQIFETDTPVEDGPDAQARFSGLTPLHMLQLDTRYARALEPGRYAACDARLRTCANLEIADGEVFTLNLKAVYGPMQMRVFDDSGVRQRDLVVGEGAPY